MKTIYKLIIGAVLAIFAYQCLDCCEPYCCKAKCHSAQKAHKCKCGEDCKCDPCLCDK